MSLTLPPLLLTSEPGSFAQHTFQTRIPRIVDNIIATNDYPAEIIAALRALREEIVGGTIQLLREETDDKEFWDAQARAYLGKTWFDLPWFWAEAFFYRRVLEATRYFQNGDFFRRDPYAPAKRAELHPDRALRAVSTAMQQLPSNTTHAFRALLHASLWGNRADLSMPGRSATPTDHSLLLIDDSARVWNTLSAHKRVDFICDNAGTELGFDLALADFMLHENLVTEIVLHLKPQPTFVSDATIRDVTEMFDAFDKSTAPELRELSQRLTRAWRAHRLTLRDHPFWVSGFFFHEMPNDLRATLAQTTLVISKGDANYRRLVGDCHWEPTTRFEDTVAYFPAPVAALRTMKAELIVGLRPSAAEQLFARSTEWLVNGTRGVIQFCDPRDSSD